MPKLIIRKGRDIVKKLTIPEDILAFTVGSEQGNDIIISEERISYFHLQFEKQTDNYFVRDLQSKWGTYINGKKITSRTILKNNDEIGLGNHFITFVQANQSANNGHFNSHREKQPSKMVEKNSNLHLFFDLRELKEKISGTPKLNQLNRMLQDDSHWENDTSQFEDQPKTEATSRANMDELGYLLESPEGRNDNYILPESENKNNPDGNGKLVTPQWGTSEPAERTEPVITERTSLPFEAPQSENSNSNTPVEFQRPQSPVITEKETNYYLLGINGYYLGRKFRIRKSRTRIGRDQKLNDIIIRKNTKGDIDQSVSRRHATINFKNDEYLISDKRSKTRTRLNRHVIAEGEEIRIQPSDEVEIISDRKSHIFRFVKEGDWNFNYPQKAGPWHLRYRLQLLSVLTGLLVLAACIMGLRAYLTTDYLTQENHRLTGELSTWYENQTNVAAMSNPVSTATQNYPAIADFNRDHFVDLVYIHPTTGTPTCVDGKTKQVLWQNSDFQALSDIPITITDLFDDGLPDILLVSDDLRLRAIDGIWGLEIWKSPILPGPLTGPPAIADFNHDGSKDLVIASAMGRIYIGFSHLESVNWTSLNIHTQTHSTASILHKANSRAPIILLGTEFGKLLFIDPLNKSVIREIDVNEEINKASGRFDISGAVRMPVAVADLNGDGQQDYVVTTTAGNILAMNGKTNKRLWFDVAEEQPSNAGLTSPMSVLGDMDGDGLADVATITPNGRIRAFKGTGKARDHKLVLWESASQKQGGFIGPLVLADIDKNGRKDVLATSRDGSISLLDGSDGHVLLKSKKALAVNGVPLVADLGNNHSIDILTLRADNQFHDLNVNSKFLTGKILFGQLYYNEEHTNYSSLVIEDSGKYDLLIGLSVFVALLAIGANGVIRKKRSRLNYY